MIPTRELSQKLIDILQHAEVISENAVIEYKATLHSKDYETELFKDVLALANSYERPNEDRWLIYGVDNKTGKLLGININDPDLLDDSNYRQKFKKIHPELHIEFITIPARQADESFGPGKIIAAFYIPCECMNEIYEVKQLVCDKEARNGKKRTFEPGVSFVRCGSSTEPLLEHHRLKIRELIQTRSVQSPLLSQEYTKEHLTKNIDVFFLLGAWDEANDSDCDMLANACGEPYALAIKELQPMLDDGFFRISGSKWLISDRTKGIEQAGKHLTKTALLELANFFGEMLSSVDLAYDLLPDERIMADIRKTNRGCSKALRESVALFCAQIGNNPKLLPLCEQDDIDRFLAEILGAVFRSDDWRVFASVEEWMPLLAEASPTMFLSFVDSYSNSNALKKFMQEKTGGIASMDLGWGLIRGIRIAAIKQNMLSKAIAVLVKISNDTSLAEAAIVDLLLPWYPTTEASAESRKGMGKYLSRQSFESAWKALIALLPGNTTSTFGYIAPLYMAHPNEPENVSMDEYWEISRSYCLDALEGAHENITRLGDIVSNIHCYKSAGLIDELCDTLSAEGQLLSADDRYKLWNQLSTYINRCRKYKEAEWVPSSDDLKKIEELANTVSPQDPFYAALRLCSVNDWDLMEDSENFQEGEKRISQLRAEAIRDLYEKEGVSVADKLINQGAQGGAVGAAISLLDIFPEDEQTICSFADDEQQEKLNLVQAYVWNKYAQKGWEWVDALNIDTWPRQRAATIYSFLPISTDAWKRAEDLLGEDVTLFWKRAPALGLIKNSPDLTYYVERLLEVERTEEALALLESAIRENVNVSAGIIRSALWSLHTETMGSMLSYYVQNLLEYLEKVSSDDELFALELHYSGLLHDKPESYLYKKMAEDPDAFLLVVSVAYDLGIADEGATQISNTTRVAYKYRVLNNWRCVPGCNKEGGYDDQAFEKWINIVRKKPSTANALKHIDREIGRVLFYSQPEDELLFPKAIADYLENNEDALAGYKMEAFNSRGVHFVDPSGTAEDEIADKYEQNASSAERQGYLNTAVMLRSIASSFRYEAERNRKES